MKTIGAGMRSRTQWAGMGVLGTGVPLAIVIGGTFGEWRGELAGRVSTLAIALVVCWMAIACAKNRRELAASGLLAAAVIASGGLILPPTPVDSLSSALVLLLPALVYVVVVYEMVRRDEAIQDDVSEQARVLEGRIAEQTSTIERASADLANARAQLVQSESRASIGYLTAGIAHEMNTPVTAVVGNVKPLWNEIARLRDRAGLHGDPVLEQSIGRLRTIAEVMARGAERTAVIVQDLRAVSHAGQARPSPMDLHESIDTALRLMRPRWSHRVAIHRDYGPVPPIEAHIHRIGQVLINLLANAFDAIEGPGNVWIRTHVEDGKAVVSVRDDGRGISPEDVARIFEPFFTTKPVEKGTGLGLAISADIVREHGGRLSAASEGLSGATFTLVLPFQRSTEIDSRRDVSSHQRSFP